MKQSIRTIGSVVAGYMVIFVAAVLAQDVLFGGVSYEKSAFSTLVVAGSLTTLGAVLGGVALAWISKVRPWIHASLLSAWLVFETSYLAVRGITENPLWFDAVGGGSLIVGVFVGVFLFVSYGRGRLAS